MFFFIYFISEFNFFIYFDAYKFNEWKRKKREKEKENRTVRERRIFFRISSLNCYRLFIMTKTIFILIRYPYTGLYENSIKSFIFVFFLREFSFRLFPLFYFFISLFFFFLSFSLIYWTVMFCSFQRRRSWKSSYIFFLRVLKKKRRKRNIINETTARKKKL